MKKIALLLLFLLTSLFSAQHMLAQTEMLKNGGFETWSHPDFPDSWTLPGAPNDNYVRESAITCNTQSKASLRFGPVANGNINGRVSQEILLPEGAKAGDIYEFTINYYVVKGITTGFNAGKDISITSCWYNSNYDQLPDASGQLSNSEGFTSVGAWSQKQFRVVAPAGAKIFLFRVVAQTTVEVVYDDFSFKKINAGSTDTPILSALPTSIPQFTTTPGGKSNATITIKGEHLLADMKLSIEGIDRAQFSVSPTTITKASATGTVTVSYLPEEHGEHTASLKITSDGAQPITIPLLGTTGQAKQLLENANFETWSGNLPEGWTSGLMMTVKESNDKVEGSFAVRTQNTTQTSNKVLQQDITMTTANFVAGDTYELRIRYKTITASATDKNIALESSWISSRDGNLSADAEKLNNGSYFTSSTWATKTILTTVPAGATQFNFRVSVGKGVVALFDDFSFKRVDAPAPTEPTLVVSPNTMINLTSEKNIPKNSSVITITTANLPNPVTLSITGRDAAQFSVTTKSIPVTSTRTQLYVVYTPTATGNHEAILTVDCVGAELLSQTIALRGSATDPNATPVIKVDKLNVGPLQAKVGESIETYITVSSENATDYVYGTMQSTPLNSFTQTGGMLLKNTSVQVKITFMPKAVGAATGTITFTSKGATPVTVTVTGVGLDAGVVPGEDEFTTEIVLNTTNPRTHLFEHFNDQRHNKTLVVDGWENVLLQGTRPWWGFDQRETIYLDSPVVDHYAKITAFGYGIPDAGVHESWLITPPLDFKNAPSKLFTFRVMGQHMIEGHTAAIELYYMDHLDGTPIYKGKIEMPMPAIVDQNEEWMEFHLDLAEQNISNTFFMGFRFITLNSGNQSSVIYYLDDISWGRTNVPQIKTPFTEATIESRVGLAAYSGKIAITASNLEEPIALSVAGPNASRFKLSTPTLPTTGGSFTFEFAPKEVGVHEAYVKLSSRGAADQYIVLSGKGTSISGLDNATTLQPQITVAGNQLTVKGDALKQVVVTNTLGRAIVRHSAEGETFTTTLPGGIYIIKGNSAHGTTVQKVIIK